MEKKSSTTLLLLYCPSRLLHIQEIYWHVLLLLQLDKDGGVLLLRVTIFCFFYIDKKRTNTAIFIYLRLIKAHTTLLRLSVLSRTHYISSKNLMCEPMKSPLLLLLGFLSIDFPSKSIDPSFVCVERNGIPKLFLQVFGHIDVKVYCNVRRES